MVNYDYICKLESNKEILDKLADSKNYGILEAVSKNLNTSSETLDKLSKSNIVQVLLNIVNNPNTSEGTLKDMYVKEQYSDVLRVIVSRLKDTHCFDSKAWNTGDYKNIITKKLPSATC